MSLVGCLSVEALNQNYDKGNATLLNAVNSTGAGVRGNRLYQTAQTVWYPAGAGNFPASVGQSVVFGWASQAGLGADLAHIENNFASTAVKVVTTASGQVQIQNAASAVLATSSSTPFAAFGWHFVELKFTFANSTTSTFEVRVDGVVAIASVSLVASLNLSTMGAIRWLTASMDFYCLNSGGGVNNDYLGDCRVEHLTASSSGADTNWTLGAGASKTAAVTSPNDGDTSYIRTANASTRETFVMTDPLTLTGTVLGVTVPIRAHGETNGAQKVAGVLRIGGTDYDGSGYGLAPNAAGVYDTPGHSVWDVSPATSATFTMTEIQNMEVGVVVLP